jgi:hypothetical protein
MKGSISGYDIIGDIHGHAEELKIILQKMGYTLKGDTWTHLERKAIFVGDYIDRGSEIKETLRIVKAMVDAGTALAIMGNHEYNALAFNYHNHTGGHIREHNEKNVKQHEETLRQFSNHKKEWDDYLAWFENLPLFREIDGLRIVHACWDDKHIAYLKEMNGPLTREILLKAHDKDNYKMIWEVFEETLKGKEITLPNGEYFIDKDGNIRTECRTRWWLGSTNLTYDQYLFHAPDNVKPQKVSSEDWAEGYDKSTPAVFFGHYWLEDETPQWQASNVCCLDYSVAKKGKLVAYRHYFDQPNSNDNFVVTEAIK